MGSKRIVVQYDITGHPLREFPSGCDAARHVNGLSSVIWNCCAGRCQTAYGFRWKFKDDITISDIEYSMILERAYGEMTNLIFEYKARAKQFIKAARENGEKEPYHFRLVLDALDVVAKDFRKRSDDAFREHTRTTDMDEDGMMNLKNAVIERAALDYEAALCQKDEGAMNELHNFAERKAQMYTNADTEEILNRIRERYKLFKDKAHEEISGIIQMTEQFRKKRDAFSEKNNPHRCPLCGGGMYIRSKLKSNSYLVGCTGCNLTEVVTVYQ